MEKIKTIIKKVDSVDIVLFTAMSLYLASLITNVAKMF